VGTDSARRYAPGFSAIAGFENRDEPDLDALAPFCEPGEPLYCEGWAGVAPPGWQIELDAGVVKMVYAGEMPVEDEAPEAVTLSAEHADRALELATLTRPGPFGLRTIELGEYFGLFDGDRLIAMAGERLFAPPLREISAVCTHPDYQGKGYAKRLVRKLIRQELLRGETPCLHAASTNELARGLYERMGFRLVSEGTMRVISKDGC
jgi:ribosomal protein S18 acetylase RimI-like enzyme